MDRRHGGAVDLKCDTGFEASKLMMCRGPSPTWAKVDVLGSLGLDLFPLAHHFNGRVFLFWHSFRTDSPSTIRPAGPFP